MRDSAIFYRSFYEAIKELPSENQLEVYNAVFEYALNFKTLELTGLSKTIFTLIRPQLEANIGKYKNGIKAKNKQKRSKKEANENGNLNINRNINDNENTKDKYSFDSFWNLYDKKVERTICVAKWKKLTEREQQLIINALPFYIKATPEVQYRKNPATYLTHRVWEDEHLPLVRPLQKKSAFEMLAETGKYE